MSYSTNMDGLDLFTAPFRSTQASRTATTSRPQQPKATASQPKSTTPQRTNATAPTPKSAVSPVSQPVNPKALAIQTQEPNIPQKPVTEEKAPAKELPSTQTQLEPPTKELTMDMSDRTIPAGKPLGTSDDAKRKAHEEAEAKRKAEWDAKQLAKKQAEQTAIQKLQAMSDADVVAASTNRVRTDVERITRRNMKEGVADHIQSVCRKDPAFARRTMHPKKSMMHCFQYINRHAKDYIQQEMKDNDIKPENGVYGGDVPDGLCYQWAEDYFNDMDAQEDKEKEERFTPRPYVSTASKSKGTTKPKKSAKKTTEKKQEPKKNSYQQISLPGV